MIDHTLIRRYIAAVYDLSVKSAQVERVGEELGRLQWAIESDPRLQGVLAHPEVTPEEKAGILLRIAGESPSEIVRASSRCSSRRSARTCLRAQRTPSPLSLTLLGALSGPMSKWLGSLTAPRKSGSNLPWPGLFAPRWSPSTTSFLK
jgi:hypothetical protein